MTPQQTVLVLIKSQPSLYGNRLEALKAIFDSPQLAWKNGDLAFLREFDMKKHSNIFRRDEEIRIKNAANTYDSALAAFLAAESRTNELAMEFAQKKMLDELKMQKDNLFVFENADMLSSSRSNFTKNPWRFSGLHFDDIPDDVSDDWKDAAKELAWNIIAYQFAESKGIHQDGSDNDLIFLLYTKKLCRQFLERMGDIEISQQDYQRRINALKREIRSLGLSKRKLGNL